MEINIAEHDAKLFVAIGLRNVCYVSKNTKELIEENIVTMAEMFG